MKLRLWQTECIQAALTKFILGHRHFLTLATPGAGKTVMASYLAKELLERDMVDLVLCFSPSTTVSIDFNKTLESVTGEQFNGQMGAKGRSLTFQSMPHLDQNFWDLLNRFRVFVIFDEIHHCAGSNLENANAWGEQILLNIQEKAKYTLALTGTPWRSDSIPIVLSQYCSRENEIHCDFTYGISRAISDKVCRHPKIVAIDNDNITLSGTKKDKVFSSFKGLLSESKYPYKEVLLNEQVILHLVTQAAIKLDKIRLENRNAAGLIIACSVEHAKLIQRVSHRVLGEVAQIITYQEDAPADLIQQFRDNDSKWVISVGMISEGTNIPRLQVCCHLTNIKTEMHYRQILGRILRRTSLPNQNAYLYMLAEPQLLEYAHRIEQDIPAFASIVNVKNSFPKLNFINNKLTNQRQNNSGFNRESNLSLGDSLLRGKTNLGVKSRTNTMTSTNDGRISIFGRFKQQVVNAGFT